MLLEWFIFGDLQLFRVTESLWAVFKRAAHVNDYNSVAFLYYNIRSEAGVGVSNGAVCYDFPKSDGVGQAGYHFVMSGTDGDHVRAAVTENMR